MGRRDELRIQIRNKVMDRYLLAVANKVMNT